MRRTFAPEPLQLKVIDMNVGREATGLVTAIYFAGLAFSPASAQDSKDRAIEQYTCKDIMRESGVGRRLGELRGVGDGHGDKRSMQGRDARDGEEVRASPRRGEDRSPAGAVRG